MIQLQVLVDADNVAPVRVIPVLEILAALDVAPRMVVSGRQQALDALDWPDFAELIADAGWQRADLVLANAYEPSNDPLLLITGDGDFGLLAARHAGQVLVVSGAPSGRLRDVGVVVDPAVEGTDPIRAWLTAVGVT